jgi:transcriptional regulator with XRE-family HTH domain
VRPLSRPSRQFADPLERATAGAFKDLLGELGWSRAEFAFRAGYASRGSVAGMLNGGQPFSWATAQRIAKRLGLELTVDVRVRCVVPEGFRRQWPIEVGAPGGAPAEPGAPRS